MFKNAKAFNQPIKTNPNGNDALEWKVEAVTDMTSMFEGAETFNPANLAYAAGSVTKMVNMFKNAHAFDKTIFADAAGTAKVTDMTSMFEDARAYNQATTLHTGKVTSMVNMFKNAYAFNQKISTENIDDWDVSKVIDMTSMFEYATVFNNEDAVGTSTTTLDWIATHLTKTNSMFKNTQAFSQPIFNVPIDTMKVLLIITDMSSMFEDAFAFNNDISIWKVDQVTLFTNMFKGAELFNKEIGSWSVNSGTNFNDMFNGALRFKQNLCNWQGHNLLTSKTNSGTFEDTSCPIKTVDADSTVSTGSVCCACSTGDVNSC